MIKTTDSNTDVTIDALFGVGAHFGFVKSRRHPSVKPFIFGVKNKVEIFDLEKTKKAFDKALDFIKETASKKGTILFVGGKNEAKSSIEKFASSINQPFVPGRWIGGSLTNFSEIKKRIDKLERLLEEKEKGLLSKYTKKERLLIDREIEKMKLYFSGLTAMKSLPKVLFIIDPRKEEIALKEAKFLKIPVIALAGSDCNITGIEFPIPANDASRLSIDYFLEKAVEAYKLGLLKKD